MKRKHMNREQVTEARQRLEEAKAQIAREENQLNDILAEQMADELLQSEAERTQHYVDPLDNVNLINVVIRNTLTKEGPVTNSNVEILLKLGKLQGQLLANRIVTPA